MSADVVIRVEALGKKYLIGHQSSERTSTFRDAIVGSVTTFGRTTADILRGKPLIAGDEIEEFWALKDVSLEIKRGDVVGVIGRNGAGKSTLLKVLSRITEPTTGRITIKGRVASLLEVGTGFHPELTGRENVFLNGAILGMSRHEIRRKFDEIVAFAEIEKFLDTPVKRYSSGMYVRLAFAVAAHLEPEILIVDEVLAVGDTGFQKKCLGKMQDVAGEGRTVLFVSHNLPTIQRLCGLSVHLHKGRMEFMGPTDQAIAHYLNSAVSKTLDADFPADRTKPDVELLGGHGVDADGRSFLNVRIYLPERVGGVSIELLLKDHMDREVLFLNTGTTNSVPQMELDRGISEFKLEFDHSHIASGNYAAVIKLVKPGLRVLLEKEYPQLFSFSFAAPEGRIAFRQDWGIGSIEAPLSATPLDRSLEPGITRRFEA